MLVLPPAVNLAAGDLDEHRAVIEVRALIGVLRGADLLLLVEDDRVPHRMLVVAFVVLEEGAQLGPTFKE